MKLRNITISLVLALSLALPIILASCGAAEESGDDDDDVRAIINRPDDDDDTEIINRPDDDVIDDDADLPISDYGGYSFGILMGKPGVEKQWWYIYVAEVTGEPLNDAMYERNRKIEEVFNIDITATISENFQSDVTKNVNAGDTSLTWVSEVSARRLHSRSKIC